MKEHLKRMAKEKFFEIAILLGLIVFSFFARKAADVSLYILWLVFAFSMLVRAVWKICSIFPEELSSPEVVLFLSDGAPTDEKDFLKEGKVVLLFEPQKEVFEGNFDVVDLADSVRVFLKEKPEQGLLCLAGYALSKKKPVIYVTRWCPVEEKNFFFERSKEVYGVWSK